MCERSQRHSGKSERLGRSVGGTAMMDRPQLESASFGLETLEAPSRDKHRGRVS